MVYDMVNGFHVIITVFFYDCPLYWYRWRQWRLISYKGRSRLRSARSVSITFILSPFRRRPTAVLYAAKPTDRPYLHLFIFTLGQHL